MESEELEIARRAEAERLTPALVMVDQSIIGYYPVDIDATVSSGWVTYGPFVEEKGEQNDQSN